MLTRTQRSERAAVLEASRVRIAAQRAETRRVVLSGKCPLCGSGLRRNLSLTGWWQCDQLGAPGFRKRADLPSCDWQGFTE